MNIDNPLIERIVLLCEDEISQTHPKIHPLYEARPTYKRFFSLINAYAGWQDISIVANSDIYFDYSLKDIEINNKTCLALSRWDVKGGQSVLHNCAGSQDVWIFQGKVMPVKYCDFHLGIPGCDNRIAWELHRAGYKMKNPAKKIKTYHYHPSDLHNYHDENKEVKPFNYIAKPYLFVEIT